MKAIWVSPYIELHCGPYDHNIYTKIKNELIGRKWNPEIKAWQVPPSYDNISIIKNMGFELDKKLEGFIEKNLKKEDKIENKITKIKGLKGKLMPFQFDTVNSIERFNNRILVALPMGCITGDSIINLNRAGAGRRVKIEWLFERLNSIPKTKKIFNKNLPIFIRAYKKNENKIGLHKIKDVLFSGIKEVFLLELENGLKLKATEEHKIMTNSGWKELSLLNKEKDLIMIDNLKTKKSNNQKNTKKERKASGGENLVVGLIFHPYAVKVKERGYIDYRVYKHRIIFEANLNNLDLKSFICLLRKDKEKCKTLKFIDPQKYAIHHKDFNYINNDITNLQKITHIDHSKLHGEINGWKNFNQGIPSFAKIKSISYYGKEKTYDIVCEEPYHNFVANGIVIHNSGKTICAAAWMQLHKEETPFIVVCPASLKYNWEREIRKWTTFKNIEILSGRPQGKLPKNTEIFILNYDILENWVNILTKVRPTSIIADETHYIKRLKSGKGKDGKQLYVKRTYNFLKLGEKCKNVIGLTGTPIINRPREIYNFVNLANPYLFPKEFNFLVRYAAGKKTRWGWDFSGASNLEELHNKLKDSVMIRKTKEEILPFLPNKIVSVIPIEIDNRKKYDDAEELFINKIESGDTNKGYALNAITILKQIAAEGKIRQAISFIDDILENDEKIVVFCHHKSIVKKLSEEFKDCCVVLTGETKLKERQEVVDKFQNDPNCKVFIGTTQAGGVGITLTAANNLIFLEFEWSDAVHQQGEDRIHRIGANKSVNIYYIVGINTIDENIIDIIDNKKGIASEIVDGKKREEITMLREILNNIKRRVKK
jgi:SWI/SNF-related matrix-associated actin-dependent regulator of chromatin subfamily A-like protein 1